MTDSIVPEKYNDGPTGPSAPTADVSDGPTLQTSRPSETPTEVASTPPLSKRTRLLRRVGWSFLAVFCLILFTVFKLPQDPIRNLIQAQISNALAPQGITFTAAKSHLSFGWGVSYVMDNVTLNFPPPQGSAHFDKIAVSPSIISSLFGSMGGSAWIYQGDGRLSASVSMKKTNTSITFSSKKMELASLGVLQTFAGISGSGVLNAEGSLSGDLSVPSTWEGKANIDLRKVAIDAQSIAGFNLPRTAISEGNIDVDISKGKATLKTFRLGKTGKSDDDIQADLTGDILLGKSMDASTLNLKAHFSLSTGLLKAFPLIDALLGAGKQPDGSFVYTLAGPLDSPVPTPGGAGAK